MNIPGMRTLPLAAWPAKTRFALVLALVLLLAATFARPRHEGDVLEYVTMATAIANHGTPDIRPGDVQRARAIIPDLAWHFDDLEAGMRDPSKEYPKPGFARNHERTGVYSIHFFTYSAMAALALTVLGALGLPVGHAFLMVNLSAVFMLGMALFRLFGSARRASAGLLLFFVCGGLLYWRWSSPEIATAAALLAATILFATSAPVLAGLLAGLAASQNPPVVFCAVFGPLFYVLLNYRPSAGIRAAVMEPLRQPGVYMGVALCLLLAATPPLFSMIQFGEPSLIAKFSTNPDLIGLPRLISFFLDPNQGMIVAVPMVAAVLAACGWRGAGPGQRRRQSLILAASCAFTLALAMPALSAGNWNSGAAGVMRYGFWAAMPLVFAFLLYLRAQQVWPTRLLAVVLALQALFMWNAKSYTTGEFSPAARWMLQHVPAWYNPDPEIFYERLVHAELPFDPAKAHSYVENGRTYKTLYNPTGGGAEYLCGKGNVLANPWADAGYGGWRYFNGEARCTGAQRITTAQLAEHGRLPSGWSTLQNGGGIWDGVWSDGKKSVITLRPDGDRASALLTITGHYYQGNERTRVRVNGKDFGWHALGNSPALEIGEALEDPAATITIELEHEMPGGPKPDPRDTRSIAFFLQRVELH